MTDGQDDSSIYSGRSLGTSQCSHDSSSANLSGARNGPASKGVHDGVSNNEMTRVLNLAKSETAQLRFWRTVVLFTLVVAGTAVSAFTYTFLNKGEIEDANNSFSQFANTIRDITDFRARNVFEAFRSLGETITAYEELSNETFPFVTLPNFEVAGSHARLQSGVEAISFLPFVDGAEKQEWEKYAAENYNVWMDQSKKVRLDSSSILQQQQQEQQKQFLDIPWPPVIQNISVGPDGAVDLVPERQDLNEYAPSWMTTPPPFAPILLNLNVLSGFTEEMDAMKKIRDAVMTSFVSVQTSTSNGFTAPEHDAFHDQFVDRAPGEKTEDRPHALIISPVYSILGDSSSSIAAINLGTVAFDFYLSDLLPDGISGIHAIVRNSCNQSHTYQLTGEKARYLGEAESQEYEYSSMAVDLDFSDYDNVTEVKHIPGHCYYTITICPTSDFVEGYRSSVPLIFAAIVAVTFLFMILTFSVYDRFVDRRNAKVVDAAARSSTIVSSLFPSNVRDRLYAQTEENQKEQAAHSKLKSFLHEGGENAVEVPADLVDDGVEVYKTKPIAELFPETTIMFGDISGFTAWSSSREPAQVFMLLETLFHSFDEIAKRRRVFKVETVGDCYVAVSGLPDPRKDHAVVMARFARDCMSKMNVLTKKLEVSLGPDTGELSMRIGLHSGPVTAGVLRGERSRFQLFGDTMNTASRMESNGVRDRIQISQETADLLALAGKDNWYTARKEKVIAKGKGEMSTFWLSTSGIRKSTSSVVSGSIDTSLKDLEDGLTDGEGVVAKVEHIPYQLSSGKVARLVEWNVDVMTKILKQIMAKHRIMNIQTEITEASSGWTRDVGDGKTVLDEVKETIALPPFHTKMVHLQEEADRIELDPEVKSQLHEFVSNVAAMYHDNPFHNFEHASHVAMSVVKLLSRIVAPVDVLDLGEVSGNKKGRSMASQLHDHTYGITSDPLTQLACVISALIHDVDHPGVPNSQLIKENAKVAAFYMNKSVAEQNSVDLAWDLLQDPGFAALRSVIHQTKDDRVRFRQLVVNSVMATDIMDKDLKALRNGRWERAFSEQCRAHDELETINRKATIVIEHLIQASDVAHTMQHWHVYRKWNERLFFEMYKAYADGRADSDPSENWYKGEIGFFDFYIIPLAKKLKECGVFGVSSDEYLNYATKNRAEWETRGQEIVQEMKQKVMHACHKVQP